jgi:predicted MarR family transcription regulator
VAHQHVVRIPLPLNLERLRQRRFGTIQLPREQVRVAQPAQIVDSADVARTQRPAVQRQGFFQRLNPEMPFSGFAAQFAQVQQRGRSVRVVHLSHLTRRRCLGPFLRSAFEVGQPYHSRRTGYTPI